MRAINVLAGAVLAGAVLAGAVGCGIGPSASTGFRFEYGRPAVCWTPALAQQQSGGISVNGIGSAITPQIGEANARLFSPPSPEFSLRQNHGGSLQFAPQPECTCEMLLAALASIDARLAEMNGDKGAPKRRKTPCSPRP